jgi:hypothetical protein
VDGDDDNDHIGDEGEAKRQEGRQSVRERNLTALTSIRAEAWSYT